MDTFRPSKQRDFTLPCRRPYTPYRLWRCLLRTHTTSQIRIKSNKECWLRGLFPHRIRFFNILFGGHFEEWSAPYCCLFHALEMYSYSLSFHMTTFALFLSYGNPIRNASFVMKFKSFPKLANILLREKCESSGVYWHKHKLEGAVYSPNLSFRKSIPRAINSPPPSRNL